MSVNIDIYIEYYGGTRDGLGPEVKRCGRGGVKVGGGGVFFEGVEERWHFVNVRLQKWRKAGGGGGGCFEPSGDW